MTPGASDSLKVEVPQSRISSTLEAVEESRGSEASWELMVSSWSPANVRAQFVASESLPFQGSGIPYLSLSRLTRLALLQSGTVDLKLGVGLYRMNRDVPAPSLGIAGTASQTTYLIPLRVGAEYRPVALEFAGFAPYGAVALLPTVGLTPRSTVEQGRSVVGLPVEAAVGTIKSLGGALAPALNLGVSYTLGKFGEGSLTGFGAQAGVRVNL